MAISQQTKEEFKLVLKEELGIEMTRSDSDQLLSSVTSYFRLLSKLSKQVESPQKPQN